MKRAELSHDLNPLLELSVDPLLVRGVNLYLEENEIDLVTDRLGPESQLAHVMFEVAEIIDSDVEQAQLLITHLRDSEEANSEPEPQITPTEPELASVTVLDDYRVARNRQVPERPKLDPLQIKEALSRFENELSGYPYFTGNDDSAIDKLLRTLPHNWSRVRKVIDDRPYWLIGRRISETERSRISVDCNGRQAVGFYKRGVAICVRDIQPQDLYRALDIERQLSSGTEPSEPITEEQAAAFDELTEQEEQVVSKLAKPLGEIALEMGLSSSTVRTHLHNVYRKIGVRNIEELIVRAVQADVLPLDDVPAGRTEVLTRREYYLLRDHYASTYKEAAADRDITWTTVRTHWHNIYEKLGTAVRGQVVLMAIKDGIIPLTPNK